MPRIEYAVDVWDIAGSDGKPNPEQLLKHLQDFGAEGWELVSVSFNLDLAYHGQGHLLIFERPAFPVD